MSGIDGSIGGLGASGIEGISSFGEGDDKAVVEIVPTSQGTVSQQGAIASRQFSAGVLEGLLQTLPGGGGPTDPPVCIEPPLVRDPSTPAGPISLRELEEMAERGEIADVYGELDPGQPVPVRDLPVGPFPKDYDPNDPNTPRLTNLAEAGQEERIDVDGPSEGLRELKRAGLQSFLDDPLPSEAEVANMSPGQLAQLERDLARRQSARAELHRMSEQELGPFEGGITPESIAEARLLAEVRERLTIHGGGGSTAPGGDPEVLIDNPGPELLRDIERNRLYAELDEPLPSEGEVGAMSQLELLALQEKLVARQNARGRLHQMSEQELGGPFIGGVTPESIAEDQLLAKVRARLVIDAR